MIGALFHLVDNAAHFIGWGAIILGALYLVSLALQDHRRAKAETRDREDQLAFLEWLDTEEEYRRRFRDAKDRAFASERHWKEAAVEAGIPLTEINKRRIRRAS